MSIAKILFVFICLFSIVVADTLADCRSTDYVGQWKFFVSDVHEDLDSNPQEYLDFYCDPITESFPNVVIMNLNDDFTVTDPNGNVLGDWTSIYNQGFELTLTTDDQDSYERWFAFSYVHYYSKTKVESECGSTYNGWVRIDSPGISGSGNNYKRTTSDWRCYYAEKQTTNNSSVSSHQTSRKPVTLVDIESPEVSAVINRLYEEGKISWFAKSYSDNESLSQTLHGSKRTQGSILSQNELVASPIYTSTHRRDMENADFPDSLDWTSYNGTDYIGTAPDQGSCGSCFAFSSAGLTEATWRIHDPESYDLSFAVSKQDIVSCSFLSQGCDGGFPRLVAGRYAMDYGFAAEDDCPYLSGDGNGNRTCLEAWGSENAREAATRYHAREYGYATSNGHYGEVNASSMVEKIQDGPLSVTFQVTDWFRHQYSGGVYDCSDLTVVLDAMREEGLALKKARNDDPIDFFYTTNHCVVAVGYGTTDDGQDFWRVRNSWTTDWGEDGYFRISRGNDACGIESLPVYIAVGEPAN
ncbi:dipeptidyl peptidase 1-like [Aduncisulcus paluster]|uniref:Dipeptidyl peptidase 1-like n=1 Tax=Aduncisulcus paluster TaxID=2918883 RepID=A0ABQ5KVD8_9EUKA|nr:dipeptidyl peptidase 1-like [Aduncisulcus paluster]